MINWYKPSDKMPEYASRIVCYDKKRGYIHMGIAIEEDGVFVFDSDTLTRYIEIENMKFYWAYASDFNFPKDEE